MESYEIRFAGLQGPICCFGLYPSDHQALRSAQNLLDKYRRAAAVWQGTRRVGEVHRAAPPTLMKSKTYLQAPRSGINIG